MVGGERDSKNEYPGIKCVATSSNRQHRMPSIRHTGYVVKMFFLS